MQGEGEDEGEGEEVDVDVDVESEEDADQAPSTSSAQIPTSGTGSQAPSAPRTAPRPRPVVAAPAPVASAPRPPPSSAAPARVTQRAQSLPTVVDLTQDSPPSGSKASVPHTLPSPVPAPATTTRPTQTGANARAGPSSQPSMPAEANGAPRHSTRLSPALLDAYNANLEAHARRHQKPTSPADSDEMTVQCITVVAWTKVRPLATHLLDPISYLTLERGRPASCRRPVRITHMAPETAHPGSAAALRPVQEG